MNIFITGATGLIGSSLLPHLVEKHQVTALVRNLDTARKKLPNITTLTTSISQYHNLNDFDAIINLAGEPIFDHRWTVAQKQKLVNSRVSLTKHLAHLINQSSNPPEVFISGSATGYYGDNSNMQITENTPAARTFAAMLCKQWENSALQAETRVCLIRTGIVLSSKGGALAKMLPLYRLGLGGKLGNGQQYWGWISIDDVVQGILFLLENKHCEGAFNFTAPNPLPQSEINQILGKQLNRPYFTCVPAFILKLVLGERSQLLLDSQNIIPKQLVNAGFEFQYPHFKQALVHCLNE